MLLLFFNPSGVGPTPPPPSTPVPFVAAQGMAESGSAGYLVPPQWGGAPIAGGWQGSTDAEPVELWTDKTGEKRKRRRKRAEAVALALLMLGDE